ncbi:hypothetical protein [Bergeyella zoohelcum]|uniref:MORN repeat variant n=1 Tax=Bergeyella zoohelcum TaxID=1015 RepID=A0A380ZTP6_9FLAO|nr:hypothetical protein [Bergeyella zoohelcum]EKB59900.1 hypothetical protein HMPREF9700_01406 [Bergeyella zoohelcum CCUG 30536]SUV52727.1 Uncharacterised protein [Bergeyella zoohelcum]
MIPTVDNKFEKFDIDDFNKNVEYGFYIYQKNNILYRNYTQSIGYLQEIYPAESIYSLNKFFHNNGFIRKKGYYFNNGSQIGIWYHFDESGKLIKEEDTDIGYDFGPMEVVKYCKENKIVLPKGYQPTGYQTRVLKQEFEGKKVWRISYQIAGDKIQQILLDGKTGKELQKKIVPFYNP